MDELKIKQVFGHELKPAIDDFYKKNGSNGAARNDDLFFVAYSNEQMVGCVRFCMEEGTAMLRTMYIDSSNRKLGIGKKLLLAFGAYLDQNHIKNVYCLPYTHLEKFYGIIDFKTVEANEVPKFLVDRAAGYTKNGTHTLFMRRL